MQPTTITQGQQLYDSKTGQSIGTVQYDTQTGKPLAAGQTTQYNLPTPTVTPTTTAVSIGTQPAYVPPTPTADSAFAELMAQQQSYQQESQRNYDAALAKDQAQETDVKNLQNQLLGQTADLQNFESQQGLPGLNSQAADLQALSQMQTAKYLEGYTQLEKSQTPLGLIQSGQNELTRQNGINALITNANISAVNGKIATAQAQVDRAMSLKYDPIKQQLENSLTFLQRYDTQLSTADQKLSAAKQQQLELQLKQIDIQKANETAIQNIALEAAKNGASASVLASIGKATSVADATVKAAGYFQDPLDVQYKKMQIANIKSEIANRGASADSGVDAANVLAYAQQYAATGQTPTGLPKGTFGVVAQTAAALPKQKGEVVSTSTGVKSNNVGAELQKGITGIYDAKNILSQMQTIFNNKKAGSFTNSDRITYNTLAGEFADALSRARSGAALTETEIQQYQSKLPSWNNLVGGTAKFNATNTSLTGKLDANLSTNGLSMYGYSQIPLGDEMYTVGDIVVNEAGQAGRINPDGSISIIN